MSGCFGNSLEDRRREAELNRYLDAEEAAMKSDDEYDPEDNNFDDNITDSEGNPR